MRCGNHRSLIVPLSQSGGHNPGPIDSCQCVTAKYAIALTPHLPSLCPGIAEIVSIAKPGGSSFSVPGSCEPDTVRINVTLDLRQCCLISQTPAFQSGHAIFMPIWASSSSALAACFAINRFTTGRSAGLKLACF